MKNLFSLKCIFIISVLVFSFTALSFANWQKSDQNFKTQQTQLPQNNQQTPHSSTDSLPNGVTQEWLNKLTDERGNRIIREEDPEGDAMQQNTFDGSAIGVNYAKSVSTAGDVNGDGFDDVIIGDPNGNNGGGTNSGRAYIYFGGTIINSTADVILAGEIVNNYFGNSVSSAGDVNSDGYDDVIIGAYGYNSFTGRAYIFYGGATMNNVADVIMTGEFNGHNFGSSVSGAGDLTADGYSEVIVGAYAANGYKGKAYIYNGGTSMNNIADVIMTGENFNDNFGYSVSGAEDVNGDGYRDVICGAYGFNGIGRAYIYFGGTSMDNTADVIMIGGGLVDNFGVSVSNAGDVNDDGYSDVIIGANGFNSNTGRAYIFYGGASMNSIADVTMTGEATSNSYGYSVSEAGDVNGDGFADVYVGAYAFSSSSGRAYLYYGGTNMNNIIDIYMTGEDTFNYFGYSVSGGGDINGDGFADMIAGAYGFNSSIGRAYVYTNTMTGEDIPDLIIGVEGSYMGIGSSVSNAGDVNGDGYDDVIVGETWFNSSTGRAYIFYGGITLDNIADVIMTGEAINNQFGYSVSSAGDVNNDGYDDVIVGANDYYTYNGKAYIFLGGASMNNTADVIMTGVTTDGYGSSVSTAGDINLDGYDDVIIGAYRSLIGTAYIYFGGASMNNVADVTMTGEVINDQFGNSVSSAGDVNGDGYSDVIVGAYANNANGQQAGRAYIFFGGSSMNAVADVILTGESAYGLFGYSTSSAGDVNGDGYDDVMVGAIAYNVYTGRVYLFLGGSSMNNAADLIMTGKAQNVRLGISLSNADDVNGDGYPDVIIGGLGSAYIYFGGAFPDNVVDVTMIGQNSINTNFFGTSISGKGDLNGDGYSDVIVGAEGYYLGNGRVYIYLSSPPDNRLNLFLYGAIQGLYDAVSNTMIYDTVTVYLRNSTSPYARVDSSRKELYGPGTGQEFYFYNAQNNTPYYIEVKHRNALETWSADPVTFVSDAASIAFSVDAIYAYGNNQIQVDTDPYNVFAFYSGDVNQDGTIDLTDGSLIDNDAINFATGYLPTDLNGDGIIDVADAVFADNNSFNFVSKITP